MEHKCHESFPPSHEEISRQLERILASPDFKATPSQIAFLEFVVNQALAGNSSQIKGYTVATEVFGRGPNYDPNIDPIVSIQADILRRTLERYYLNAGKNGPIPIDIPKDTYVPVFKKRKLPCTYAFKEQWRLFSSLVPS